MKNRDLPAFRQHSSGYTEGSCGLTKREIFAMAAMNGILAHSTNYLAHDPDDVAQVAQDAIKCADELLKQLEA